MNRNRPLTRDQWLHRILRAALAVFIGILIYQMPLDFLEAYTYDWRVTLKPDSPTSGKIVTVALDTPSLKALPKGATAASQAEVFARLLAAKPARLVLLTDPSVAKGSAKEKLRLAQVLEDPRVLVAVDELPPAGKIDFFRLPKPFSRVRVSPGPVTADRSVLAKGGVTRRLIVSSQGQPTYQIQLARDLMGQKEWDLDGQFDLLDARQAYIDFRPSGTYVPISYLDIVKDNFDPSALSGKVILFGRDTRESVKDYVKTPYSREVVAMNATELQANILDTVFLNRAPQPVPQFVRFILSIAFALLTVYVVLALRPLRGLGILAGAILGFILISQIFFLGLGWLIPMAHPLLTIFVCYYFFIPYRLIMENRRSWEYYQKNKLLTQVEELKSNFLRMMSHDLKTPLARIQGMANVVLADANPLTDGQRRAVETMYRSSEELADFIGSILNLGRIESKEIKLQVKSRDLNSLLREVIRKSEFLARKKGIEIRTEFEPMFSFKVDEDLIRQVFTNLLENAVKYSPEGGKILVTTEELEGRAIVQVADQGIGIAPDDLPHVFDKFYRSRGVRQSEVSGSGLGLYLVKYFVELHQGRVEVESELGRGSTFTVSLPMVMDSQTRATWREGELHV